MNDSRFAVAVFIAYCAICTLVGAVAMWISMSGPHDCSVTMEYAGSHRAEYMTECAIG